MLTKSGIMCGLGEEWDELLGAMRDVRARGVDILTLGQYLRPSRDHLPIARYYTPDEFAELRRLGREMGYRHVEAGPPGRPGFHPGGEGGGGDAQRAPPPPRPRQPPPPP